MKRFSNRLKRKRKTNVEKEQDGQGSAPHNESEVADATNPAAVASLEDAKALIQQLQETNKAQQKTLEAEQKSKEVLQETNKAQQKTLEAQQKTLEARDKTLEARDKTIEELQATSVQNLVKYFREIPCLETNRAGTPSVPIPSNAKNQTNEGQQTSERDVALEEANATNGNAGKQQKQGGHLPAAIGHMQERVQDSTECFSVKFEDQQGRLIKSIVATKISHQLPNERLRYNNEASVAYHVLNLIEDVLACLGLSTSTAAIPEMSIFSMRPDIVVVRWRATIVLVIEVKNPGKDDSELVEDNFVAGQVFDYAMGMRQMGLDHPFVCLTSYDKMVIGTLHPSSHAVFRKAVEKLKEKNRFYDEEKPGTAKPPVSPAKIGNLVSVIPDDSQLKQSNTDNSKEEVDEASKGESDEEVDRTIYFSEVFDTSNMFTALYFAVACGVVAAISSTETGKPELVPTEGEETQQYIACLTRDSFTWKRRTFTPSYSLKCNWQVNMKVYLHCVLGHGHSGKVYLASDTRGRMFAMKMYLFDSQIMVSFQGQTNEEKRQEQKKIKTKLRDDEAKMWKDFYPSYKKAIYCSELNDVPCLMMPYVASIPMGKRKAYIGQIKEEIMRFAKKKYVYTSTDVRWRHVGLRKDSTGTEKIVLVDLESMEHFESAGIEFNEKVESSISALEKRACDADDTQSPPQGLIHC